MWSVHFTSSASGIFEEIVPSLFENEYKYMNRNAIYILECRYYGLFVVNLMHEFADGSAIRHPQLHEGQDVIDGL